MKDFKLCIKSVNPDDLNDYSIWGEIYAEIDGQSFPDDMWYDAVSSIIHMWLENTIDYLTGNQEQWELFFMDGPYKICLSGCSDNSVLVKFIAHNENEINRIIVKKSNIIKELLNCTKTFINICYRDAPNSTTMRMFIDIQKMYKTLKEKTECIQRGTRKDSPDSTENGPTGPK